MGHWPPNDTFSPTELEQTLQLISTPLSCPQVREVKYEDGFGVKNGDDIVQFWIQGEWQNSPNELWGWWFVPMAWADDHYVADLWDPKLLLSGCQRARGYPFKSLFQGVTLKTSTRSAHSAAKIAPMLFRHPHDFEDRRLGRTCRSVRRDWVSECPVREPKDCDRRVVNGAVWHRVEGEWRMLPNTCWVWSLGCSSNEWWVERHRHRQSFLKVVTGLLFCSIVMTDGFALKLVQPVDDSVGRNPSPTYPSVLLSPLSSPNTPRRSSFLTAAALPPELFKYVCNAADSESGSMRPVCRYWNRLCTPRVFERIDIKTSPERIRAFWKHRTDLRMRHVEDVANVPEYDKEANFPWVHLLSQACVSTQSVWKMKGDLGRIDIEGPFPGGHRTVRSVHFALPRSLPRSLSHGIKEVNLLDIHFRQFEVLIRLVCELPDLEELSCSNASFGSLPIELPLRRPRTSRNNLRKVDIWDHERDICLLPPLTLYLGVYDVMTFFSEGEIAAILGLLQVSNGLVYNIVACDEDDPCNYSRRLDFKKESDKYDPKCTFLSLQTFRAPPPPQHSTGILVIADCRDITEDKDIGLWARFDSEFSKISAQIRQVECVFGFRDRAEMVHFAETILGEKMTAISRLAVVRHSIY